MSQIIEKTVLEQARDTLFKFGAKTCSSQFGHQVATDVFRGPTTLFRASPPHMLPLRGRSEIELLFALRRTVSEIISFFKVYEL